MSRRFRIPALLLVLACAGPLAGCGVKGPLEPPGGTKTGTTQTGAAAPAGGSAVASAPAEAASPTAWAETSDTGRSSTTGSANSSVPVATEATSSINTTRATTGSSSGGAKASITTAPVGLNKIQRPNTPFVLDGLL